MKRILIIEDDKALSKGIVLALQNKETEIIQCFTIAAAESMMCKEKFDLVILDINLPDGNGLDYLCESKQRENIPIILLTANDMETDVVMGFEMGADDYITKPFSLAVLRARVNAQLRKNRANPPRYQKVGLSFDFDKMVFFKNTILVELSKTEQRLLRILVENEGKTIERGVLVDRIWTDSAGYVDENALSVTIKRLRDKLEDNPSKPEYIKTVYGIGYSWAVK